MRLGEDEAEAKIRLSLTPSKCQVNLAPTQGGREGEVILVLATTTEAKTGLSRAGRGSSDQ